MRKRIGINIDGIIRNYLDRFEKVYISTYISNPSIVDTNDQMTEIKILTPEEEEQKALNIQKEIEEKIKKPIDSFDLLNHFHFEPGYNYLGNEVDAQGKLEEFMYEIKPFPIFGQADPYKDSIDTLHKLQLMGDSEDLFDVVLLSTLKSKAITATYSFLANNTCRARNVMFVGEDYDKWDYCDVLIDIMPESIQTKPEGKIVVKIEHEFNKWDQGDYNFKSLKEAYTNKEFIEKIREYCK